MNNGIKSTTQKIIDNLTDQEHKELAVCEMNIEQLKKSASLLAAQFNTDYLNPGYEQVLLNIMALYVTIAMQSLFARICGKCKKRKECENCHLVDVSYGIIDAEINAIGSKFDAEKPKTH